MKPADLLKRLERVRRRTRRLVAVEALGRLVLAIPIIVIGLILLDRSAHMPAALRAAASLAGVWIAAAWLVRRVLRPLRQSIPLQEVALRLDHHVPQLGDRLS